MPNEFVIRNGYISSGDSFVATRLGVGSSPDLTTRLDVRAQGALSTDIAFRVRNSVDSANIFYIQGNGTVGVPWGDGYVFEYGVNAASNFGATITKNGQYGTHFRIHQFGGVVVTSVADTGFHSFGQITLGTLTTQNYKITSFNGFGTEVDHIYLAQGQNQTRKSSILFGTNYNAGLTYSTARIQSETYIAGGIDRNKFNFWLSNGTWNVSPTLMASLTCKSNFLLSTPTEDINDSNTIYIPNGTAPTSSITDGYKQYSADIVAGNAAPHFRTENGTVIRLYQQSATTTTQGLADTLTNLGFLASGSTIESLDQLQIVLNSQVFS